MSPDIIIGAVLGSGSLIGLAYVASQIAARLLDERRPSLVPLEEYGDVIEVPQDFEAASESHRSGGGTASKGTDRLVQQVALAQRHGKAK